MRRGYCSYCERMISFYHESNLLRNHLNLSTNRICYGSDTELNVTQAVRELVEIEKSLRA